MKLSCKGNPPRVRRNRMRSGGSCPSFLIPHVSRETIGSDDRAKSAAIPFHSAATATPVSNLASNSEQCPALYEGLKEQRSHNTAGASREITT